VESEAKLIGEINDTQLSDVLTFAHYSRL